MNTSRPFRERWVRVVLRSHRGLRAVGGRYLEFEARVKGLGLRGDDVRQGGDCRNERSKLGVLEAA